MRSARGSVRRALPVPVSGYTRRPLQSPAKVAARHELLIYIWEVGAMQFHDARDCLDVDVRGLE